MGADDYVTIPFSPRALVDRLRTLMRRRSHVSPENLGVVEGGTADFSKPAL
jgi:DNA-binding response OmpR family regulator